MIDSPLCRKCGAEKGTSAHVLYECEVLATLKHTYLGLFFLDPEDVISQSLGQSETLLKKWASTTSTLGKKSLSIRPTYMGTERARTHLLFYSILILAKYYTFRAKLLFFRRQPEKANVIRAYHFHLLSSYVANFII